MEKINKEDLIRRNDAIESVCKVSCGRGYCGMPCDEVKAIEQLPSAQPERKTGQWQEDPNSYGFWGYGFWICSACGFVSEASGADLLYNFCPNCGADMRKGEEQE